MAAVATNMAAAAVASIGGRQPTTTHLLRLPIVQWLQSEFSLSASNSAKSGGNTGATNVDKSITTRNRQLQSAPCLFISHLPLQNNNNNNNTNTRIRPSSRTTPLSQQQQQQQRQTKQQRRQFQKHLEKVSQQVYSTCSHQLGWRCVPTTALGGGLMIAPQDRKELWDVSQRTGAFNNIVAVGSSAAMSLAKSLTDTDPEMEEELENNNNPHASITASNNYHGSTASNYQRILIPLTLDAVWTSTTSHVLLWNDQQHADDPILSPLAATPHPVMVVLDPRLIYNSPEIQNVAYQAAVALALDAFYDHLSSFRRGELPKPVDSAEELPWKPILHNWIQQQLQEQQQQELHDVHQTSSSSTVDDTVLQALAVMGAATRFGSMDPSQHCRSIPLAIAASLVPRLLIQEQVVNNESSTHPPNPSISTTREDNGMLLLQIMASLVPGLLRLIVELDGVDLHDEEITKLRQELNHLQLVAVRDDTNANNQSTTSEPTRDFPTPTALYFLANPLLSSTTAASTQQSNNEGSRDMLLDIILDLVQENREHWNCQDVDDAILEQVVYDSLDPSL